MNSIKQPMLGLSVEASHVDAKCIDQKPQRHITVQKPGFCRRNEVGVARWLVCPDEYSGFSSGLWVRMRRIRRRMSDGGE